MFMMLNISRNERSKVRSNLFAICESTNIPVYLPVDMYGGGGGGGGGGGTSIPSTPVSICHEGLLVHYICQDYNHTLRTILGKRRLK